MQTGDPTGMGRGGVGAARAIYDRSAGGQSAAPPPPMYVIDEPASRPLLKHSKPHLLSMASMGAAPGGAGGRQKFGSQFFFTVRGDDMAHLDSAHAVFGEIAEGEDVLAAINAQYLDDGGRPFRDVRLRAAHVLDDPYKDPPGLAAAVAAAAAAAAKGGAGGGSDDLDGFKPPEETAPARIGVNESLELADGRTEEEVEAALRAKEAASRAQVLEMIGDIPDAEVRPPDNCLFVCKLNAVTEDEDLETIFSRFGRIVSWEVIKDQKSGDSLQYVCNDT